MDSMAIQFFLMAMSILMISSKFKLFKLIDEAKKLSKNKSVRNIFKDHVLIPYLPNNLISRIRFHKNKDNFQNRLKILKNGQHFIEELTQ